MSPVLLVVALHPPGGEATVDTATRCYLSTMCFKSNRKQARTDGPDPCKWSQTYNKNAKRTENEGAKADKFQSCPIEFLGGSIVGGGTPSPNLYNKAEVKNKLVI